MSFLNLFRFKGGIQVRSHKAEVSDEPVRELPIPREIVLPLRQHIGKTAEPIVEPGQRVLKGQMVAKPSDYVSAAVHASTSGTVVGILDRPVPHPSGLSAPCIVIHPDGEDQWLPLTTHANDYVGMDPSRLRNLVREAGIVGLGGAGFPSFIKLNPGPSRQVHTLIINGAECEPYISCDHLLMRERPGEVIAGALLLMHALKAPRCLIAVEDNKPDAIDFLIEACAPFSADGLSIVPIPTRYPAGGEKQLIYTLTGHEVPSRGLPLDIGVVCQNVATAASIYRAVFHGEPLVSRIVTVAGEVEKPGNYQVLIGTPVHELLKQVGVPGGLRAARRVLIGGPMMGHALHTLDTPVIKTTNCVLVDCGAGGDLATPPPTLPCIRCGKCAEVCPIRLVPQQLYWYAKAREFDIAREYNLFDCIECGCCDYVCPSKIPLVQYYRYAKSEIWAKEQESKKADHARVRFESRKSRLEREAQEKAERLQKKKAGVAAESEAPAEEKPAADAKQAAILAALERVNARKQQQAVEPKNVSELTEEQQRAIAEVDARRAQQQPPPPGE